MASLLCKQTKAVSYELSIKQPKRGFLCGDYNAKRYPVSIRINFFFHYIQNFYVPLFAFSGVTLYIHKFL